MTELMERLSRANPLASGEPATPAERAEADRLLERLVNEPLPERDPRPRLRVRPRRVALAGAIAAALAAASLGVADLLDTEPSRNGILDRAVAAVSEDDVIYAITMRESSTITPLEGPGRVVRESAFRRMWLWAGGASSRSLDYRLRLDGTAGRPYGETVSDASRVWIWDAERNEIIVVDRSGDSSETEPASDDYPGLSPFSDPGAQLREHVDEGALRVAGRTRFHGRSAYRLVSKTLTNPLPGILSERVTYLVDARTFLPLAMRLRVLADLDRRERHEIRVDYLRYDRLPPTDANQALLRMGPHPGA